VGLNLDDSFKRGSSFGECVITRIWNAYIKCQLVGIEGIEGIDVFVISLANNWKDPSLADPWGY